MRIGHAFAFLMIAIGLLLSLRGANLLPLVGLFVWLTGSRELAVVRARHAVAPAGFWSGPSGFRRPSRGCHPVAR